jgi:hypothetical protein
VLVVNTFGEAVFYVIVCSRHGTVKYTLSIAWNIIYKPFYLKNDYLTRSCSEHDPPAH